MLRRLGIIALILLTCNFAACSRATLFGAPKSSGDKFAGDEGEAPLSFTISQAFVDNGMLNVKVVLEPKTELDPRALTVSLIGLHEGNVVAEATKRASDVYAGQSLEAGEMLAMRFEVDASELSEYQVKCSWGKESEKFLSDAPAPAKGAVNNVITERPAPIAEPELHTENSIASGVEEVSGIDAALEPPVLDAETETDRLPTPGRAVLRDLRTVKGQLACDNPPCDILYTVVGQLVNEGDTPVRDVQLAIGLYWVNEGQKPVFPTIADAPGANEELLSLQGLELSPGASKRIRINVDRSVPLVPGGRFVPYLRLLGFQAVEEQNRSAGRS